MQASEIHCIFVIGAGVMGQQIALQCAMNGFDVIMYDVSPEALERAEAQLFRFAEELVSQGKIDSARAKASLSRIKFTTNPNDAAEADLVSESVPEDPDLKARVFAQFNSICPSHAIFTTNTSTLAPSLYADATGRPSQFAALHFHQPVWECNLADIMPHAGTSAKTMNLLYDFAKSIGQMPLVFKKESPRYVANAILDAIHSAAFKLVRDGVASVEDVDRAFMIVMKAASGPFGSLDFVGLDTVWHILQSKARMTQDPQIQAQADYIKENFVDKGWLGIKSGKGFYTYPDPAYLRPDFLTGGRNPFAA